MEDGVKNKNIINENKQDNDLKPSLVSNNSVKKSPRKSPRNV